MKKMMATSKAYASRWQLTDFDIPRLMSAINAIKSVAATETEAAPSECLVAMEALLTTCVSDESEWSSAWTKLTAWSIKHQKVPGSFAELGLDIPKEFMYMLNASVAGSAKLLGEGDVKKETSDLDSLLGGDAAAEGEGGKKLLLDGEGRTSRAAARLPGIM